MKHGHPFETYLSHTEIQKKVAQLGAQISEDYKSSKDLICVCVLKGSLIFFSDLIRNIDADLKIDFIRASSYGNEHESSGIVQIVQDLSMSIENKDVLIVEDIVDTGNTLRYLIDTFALKKPKSLKLCSLLFKPDKLKQKLSIDYLGFSIPDHYVIGYGMDSAEQFRNLPDIVVYKQPT